MESRDHVPSRVLLDEPYPENLPWVWACIKCNGDISIDEEYLACLIDCTIAGTVEPEKVGRAKVRRILTEKPALAARLAAAKSSVGNRTIFSVEEPRVQRVAAKLARGHAIFELNEADFREPSRCLIRPLIALSDDERGTFESVMSSPGWPEVGSRAMQRLLGIGDQFGWIVVQPRRYRYQANSFGDERVVRIVMSEYLAVEVAWTDDW